MFHDDQKNLQNGRPTALSGLREDRSQHVLKTRDIELQTKVQEEIKCYFCILAHILSNIGSILIK